jgi:hypothetical protein
LYENFSLQNGVNIYSLAQLLDKIKMVGEEAVIEAVKQVGIVLVGLATATAVVFKILVDAIQSRTGPP